MATYLDIPEDLLARLYGQEKRRAVDIAKELNVTPNTIWNKLQKFNIPVRGRRLKLDEDKLVDLYCRQHLSLATVGKQLGIAHTTVRKRLNSLGVKVRDHSAAQFHTLFFNGHNPGFHQGPDNPSWRGGRTRTKQGYILVHMMPDDFFYRMSQRNKKGNSYILEHRLVMAKHLGRCLLPWEVVHHRNGTKDDNRIENLELLFSKNHAPDAKTKAYITGLEKTVEKLRAEIRRLHIS